MRYVVWNRVSNRRHGPPYRTEVEAQRAIAGLYHRERYVVRWMRVQS